VATSLNNLALLCHDQGQYAKAEPLYERALAVWEKAFQCLIHNLAFDLKQRGCLFNQRLFGQSAVALACGFQKRVLDPG
jgi:tetratricopeptide (TPR) repeat protein